MKKIVCMIILIFALLAVGCDVKDGDGMANPDVKVDSEEIQEEKVETKKEKIDIGNMVDILEPVLDSMAGGKKYSDLFSGENLSWLGYSIMWYRDIYGSPDVQIYNGDSYSYLMMNKSDMDMYLKATYSEFDSRVIDGLDENQEYFIFTYFDEKDAYFCQPASGDGWIELSVVDAYSNGDGTYTAYVDATMAYNVEEENEYLGRYNISMIRNESSSKYEYSITNIE